MSSRLSDLRFNPPLEALLALRRQSPLTVLSGANNSGKSLVLKWLKSAAGETAYLVGTNRFYHIYHISTAIRDPNQIRNFENQFRQQFQQEEYNHEQNFIDLQQILIGLSDKKRAALFEICGKLIGNRFSLQRVDPTNELSPRYVDVDGQNLSVNSTGTRLLMTMLGICMDERFDVILIDEPELGLSPRVQLAFANFLLDPAERRERFPHLSTVFLATHSHLILNRNDLQSNYIVSKVGKDIAIEQIQSINDFHRLQFNLLGNTFETMFLPAAIVVVEGKTDFAYLEKIIQSRFPSNKILVLPGSGDVKRKVAQIREVMGDLQRSPMRSRLFVVLDSIHQAGLKRELEDMGVIGSQVVIWLKNGIEYVYPPSVLASVFSCSEEAVAGMQIDSDRIHLNGIEKTKAQLSGDVVRVVTASTRLPEELEEKLLIPITSAIS